MDNQRVISFTQRFDEEGRTVLKPKTQADLEAMDKALRNPKGVRFDKPMEEEPGVRVCPVALGDPYGLTVCAMEDDWNAYREGKIGKNELESRVERRLELAERYREEGLTPEIESAIKQIEAIKGEQSEEVKGESQEVKREEVSHGESALPSEEHMVEGDAAGSASQSGEEA